MNIKTSEKPKKAKVTPKPIQRVREPSPQKDLKHLPEWYKRVWYKTITYDPSPEDFDEDISDLESKASIVCECESDDECECYLEEDNESTRSDYSGGTITESYSEYKEMREDRLRELIAIRKEEEEELAALRKRQEGSIQYHMAWEQDTELKEDRKRGTKGQKLALARDFTLYSSEYVRLQELSWYDARWRFDFYWPEEYGERETKRHFVGLLYFGAEVVIDLKPFEAPRRAIRQASTIAVEGCNQRIEVRFINPDFIQVQVPRSLLQDISSSLNSSDIVQFAGVRKSFENDRSRKDRQERAEKHKQEAAERERARPPSPRETYAELNGWY